MDANPFSIESILKKSSSSSVAEEVKETQPSRSIEALSLAVKLAGKSHLIKDKCHFSNGASLLRVLGLCEIKNTVCYSCIS